MLGAYVRLTGPKRFRIANANLRDLVGYALPAFDDATRADLLEQARQLR